MSESCQGVTNGIFSPCRSSSRSSSPVNSVSAETYRTPMSPRQSEKLSQHSSSRSASQNLPSYLPGMLLLHQHGPCCSHMHHAQDHTHAPVQAALSSLALQILFAVPDGLTASSCGGPCEIFEEAHICAGCAGKSASAARGRQRHQLVLLVLLLPALTGLAVMCVRLRSSEEEHSLILPPSATVYAWRGPEEGKFLPSHESA